MIHPGRASQMHHVEAVEPTFDTLDSAHDCSQLPLKTQLLTPPWFGTRVALKPGARTESARNGPLQRCVMATTLKLLRKWKASYHVLHDREGFGFFASVR